MSRPTAFNRRSVLKSAGLGLAAGLAGCSGITGGGQQEQLKIGLIAPLSGPLSLAAKEMQKGAQLAVSEVNEAGGVFDQDVELVVEDSQSSPETGAQVARELIQQENVHGVVGTVSSAIRNAAFDVITDEVPLFYPPGYEGGICHDYFFGLGPVPNQYMGNSIPYMMEEFGSDVFLVGSDFAYPQALHPIVKEMISANGGNVVGEEFAPITNTEWGSVINNVQSADPSFMIATTPGPTGVALMSQMHGAGILGDIPVNQSVLDEPEISAMDQEVATNGIYTVLDYFMSLDNEENQSYKSRYRDRFGEGVIFGIGVNTFIGTQVLANAASEAGSTAADDLISVAEGLEHSTPKGPITIDPENHHNVTDIRLGMVTDDSYPSFAVQETFPQQAPEIEC